MIQNDRLSDDDHVFSSERRITGIFQKMENEKDASEYMIGNGKQGEPEVTTVDDGDKTLIYKVNDVPPLHLTVLFALQVITPYVTIRYSDIARFF